VVKGRGVREEAQEEKGKVIVQSEAPDPAIARQQRERRRSLVGHRALACARCRRLYFSRQMQLPFPHILLGAERRFRRFFSSISGFLAVASLAMGLG
jgi:hypothetical protein